MKNSDLSQMAVRLLEQRYFKHEAKGLEGSIFAGAVGTLEEQERNGWWVRFSESEEMIVTHCSKKSVSLLLRPSQFTPVRPFSLIKPKLDWYSMGRDHCDEDLAFYICEPTKQVSVIRFPEPTTERRYCLACQDIVFNTHCPKDGTMTVTLDHPEELRDLESELGTLEIVERIESGYSADVYKAVRKSDRKVFALKMLQARFQSIESWLSGFNKEAVALGQLSHPNIVKLYATGTFEKKPYHILEFIDGATVAECVAISGTLHGVRGQRELSEWFAPICDALSYMNKKGILHEDLKSSDIMIDRVDQCARIIDLGKARPIGHLHGTSSINGAFSGNVNYTAPERCLGGSHYTYKANIYSLGCILYECVAGVTPFFGGTIVQVGMKHMNAQAEDLMISHPEIKSELNHLILSMLSKRANDRPDYEEIKAVLKAL